jgi:endoglucanase
MYNIIKISLLISALCCTGLMATPPDLKVNGKYLQTISGSTTVRLVGVNICGNEWSATSYGPPSGFGGNMILSVNSAISTWKSNCLRVPLNQDFWFGYSDGSYTSSTTQNTTYQNKYRGTIDSIISAASAKNVYIELDLHWSGTGSWGSSVTAKQQNMPDDNSVTFWKDVATRYKNNPAVLFNLYNEPKDDSWSIWKNGGQSGSGFHTPGFQALVDTIRNTGANNVIVVGGLAWAYDMTGISSYALSDPIGHGIAYEAHIYDNKGTGEPAIWNTNVTVAVSAGYCVIIGEFGANTSGSQDNSGCTPFESDLITWINGTNTANYEYSALAWSFNTDATPRLISDWNFTATTCHGSQVKTWLSSITTTSALIPSKPVKKTMAIKYHETAIFDVCGRKVLNNAVTDYSQLKNGVYMFYDGSKFNRTVICR